MADNLPATSGNPEGGELVLDAPRVEPPPPVPPLFPLGLRKLALLYIGTLGAYQLLWLYWHWRHLRDFHGARVRPALRSLFGIFFIFPLAWRIGRGAGERRPVLILAALGNAVLWIVLLLVARSAPDEAQLVFLPLTLLPLLALQARANDVNRRHAPGHEPNTRLKWWGWLVIIVGSCLFLLAMVGAFLSDSTIDEDFRLPVEEDSIDSVAVPPVSIPLHS